MPASSTVILIAPMIAEPSGLERVRWKSSAFSPMPRMMRVDLGAARHRRVVVLEHQRRGALGDDEAVAILGERSRHLLRRLVGARQRR